MAATAKEAVACWDVHRAVGAAAGRRRTLRLHRRAFAARGPRNGGRAARSSRAARRGRAGAVRSPGQELIWPGHFVFGYPSRNPDNPRVKGPVANAGDDATSEFARNGSLLVYRRLAQDVAAIPGFLRRFCAPRRRSAQAAGPHRGQMALRPADRRDPGDPPPDHSYPVYNEFTFLGDRMQHRCPLSAHIRKVNPRLGGSDLDNAVPRLLRRGVPFGPKYEEGEQVAPPGGRGLAFLAYQSSIRHQFGAIITEWVNNSTAPNNGGGQDFLIGQIPDPVSAQRIFVVPPQIRDGAPVVGDSHGRCVLVRTIDFGASGA